MRIYQFFCATLLAVILFGCGDEDLIVNKNKKQSFGGSFKVLATRFPPSVENSGTSTLYIDNGRYISTTDEAYGRCAGRLEVTENKINFIDTTFRIITGDVLPPRVLSGTYDYKFDGDKLEVGTKYESGWVEIHTFTLVK